MARRLRKAVPHRRRGRRPTKRASEPNGAFLWIYDDVRLPSVLCFIVSVTMRRKAEGSPRSQKCVICSQAKSSEQGACTPIKFHSLLKEHYTPRPRPRPDNLAFSPPCATWVISLSPKVPKDPTMYVRMRHAGNNLGGGRAEWRGGRRR